METGGRQRRAEYSHGPKCVNWTSLRLLIGAKILTNIDKTASHIGRCRRTNAVQERETAELRPQPASQCCESSEKGHVRLRSSFVERGTLARSLSNGRNDGQECPSSVSQLAIGHAVEMSAMSFNCVGNAVKRGGSDRESSLTLSTHRWASRTAESASGGRDSLGTNDRSRSPSGDRPWPRDRLESAGDPSDARLSRWSSR